MNILNEYTEVPFSFLELERNDFNTHVHPFQQKWIDHGCYNFPDNVYLPLIIQDDKNLSSEDTVSLPYEMMCNHHLDLLMSFYCFVLF